MLVAEPNGASGIELPAINQVVVPMGQKPTRVKLGPLNGQIDPGLDAMLGGTTAQPNTSVSRMTLQAATRRVISGDLVLLPVWLVKAANVANLNLELTYDPNVVRPEGAIGKGNLLDNALFTPNANERGKVRLGFAQTSGFSGTGTAMNMPLRAVGKPGDRTRLDLIVTTINDPAGGVLTIDKIPGEIVILNPDGTLPGTTAPPSSGAPPSVTPSGTNPPTSAAPPGGIPRGDCDGDAAVSEVDALCAMEMSTQVRPAKPIMDVDRSNDVTSRDAVIILQRARWENRGDTTERGYDEDWNHSRGHRHRGARVLGAISVGGRSIDRRERPRWSTNSIRNTSHLQLDRGLECPIRH